MARRHCIHRWILGEPHLGSVKGQCRRCGARKTYPSFVEVPPEGGLDGPPPEVIREMTRLEEPVLA